MFKKGISIAICIFTVAALLTGCSTGTGSTPAASSPSASEASAASPTETQQDLKFAIVLHALNSSFYAKMQEGALEAGKALGVKVDVMAPNTASNLAEQVSMLETCVSSGYNGIGTVIWDPTGFNDVLAKAKTANIPVVAFNQNSGTTDGTVFIGQDLEQSGYMLGKYMFGTVMNGQGKYIIASCAPQDSALIARTNGIKRAAEEFPNIQFIDLVNIGTDLTNAESVIENAYLAHPDVTAFLGVDVFSEAIGTFIQAKNLNGKVYAAGFDLTEGTLKHVSDGAMQLTIGQNPFLQGYYSVVELYTKAKYGYDLLDMNTGAFLVTKDNVANVKPE